MSPFYRLSVYTLLSLSIFTTQNAAAGDPAKGKAKAAVCAACHGADGKKTLMPTYPKLAGQNAAYLKLSMKAYKDKTRSGPQAAIMHGQMATLSDEDIDNLAAYYEQLQ